MPDSALPATRRTAFRPMATTPGALPTTIGYGVVTWQAVSAVADGADVDGNPDAVPVTGTLTFTPSASILLATGDKVTVIATPVTYTLDDTGVLRDSEGRNGVTLVATDSPGITPTGWTWTVAYKLNNGLSRGSFSFALPTGSTVDLTTVAPVASSNGAAIIQGPGVATGGATGQVLAKASPADYDTTWVDPATGGTGGTTSPATTTSEGIVQLAGDLGGTASAPTVTGGTHHGHTAGQVTGLATVATTGAYSDLTGKPTIPTVSDATTTAKGVVELAGDLGGTAAAPTVTGGTHHGHAAGQVTGLATVATSGSYADLTNKPAIPAAYTDEQAQDAVGAAIAAGTQSGISVTYNDATNAINFAATGTTSPDATTTSKGIVQLAGDLAGTAAAPTVPGLANKANTADLATVATSGSYTDLINQPTIPPPAPVDSVNGQTGAVVLTAADVGAQPAGSYATAAQGAEADTAVQPGDLATVATSGAYTDLTNKPAIPTQYTDAAAQAAYEALSGTATNPVTDAAAARPTGLVKVFWQCPTQPANWAPGDEWINNS